MNKQNRDKLTAKNTGGCQMGGGLGSWVEKVKALRHTNQQLQSHHRDVRDSIGNIVDNMVTCVHNYVQCRGYCLTTTLST